MMEAAKQMSVPSMSSSRLEFLVDDDDVAVDAADGDGATEHFGIAGLPFPDDYEESC